MTRPARTAVAWCPDWPLSAAGIGPAVPAAIVRTDLVSACTAAARDEGVRVGQKRRDAQRACPGLRLLPDDPLRDGREFERIVGALTGLVPRVEVVQPGLLAFPAIGAARYHGGEERLAELVIDTVGAASGGECWFGVADGLFAAALASRRGVIVPIGQTPAFLGGFPVGVLGRPELANLLHRLGIRTLGEFAALPGADVLARFGPDGAVVHRLSRGLDERPVAPRHPEPDLVAVTHLDPPAVSVAAAAFAVRPLADELHALLADRGLICTLLAIEAETVRGGLSTRLWRHGSRSATAVVDRLRWQLEGWLAAGGGGEISVLRLVPEEVVRAGGEQLDLSGGDRDAADRMARAVARVQGLLGPDAAVVAVPGGGRGPADRLTWVPWDEPRHARFDPVKPWPGGIPPPYPAVVYADRWPAAELVGQTGTPVRVDGRGALSEPPARLMIGEQQQATVTGWGGPWPVDERWWDPARHRRLARMQVATTDGRAYLLTRHDGRWHVEAEYD
ncbi:MAG: DNA polymerase Y family protein [Actinobacteria bacterium]|nr:DNA polymerase Y family protein [Actinomycetota bacterium]MBI3686688.1 DNA polymerase Y family protein [Actinomycetota bacterium]